MINKIKTIDNLNLIVYSLITILQAHKVSFDEVEKYLNSFISNDLFFLQNEQLHLFFPGLVAIFDFISFFIKKFGKLSESHSKLFVSWLSNVSLPNLNSLLKVISIGIDFKIFQDIKTISSNIIQQLHKLGKDDIEELSRIFHILNNIFIIDMKAFSFHQVF